jgi:hypothetical protein
VTQPTETKPAEPDDALDAIILHAAGKDWTKVAVFIARAVDAAKVADREASGQEIAARIYALVDSGELEAKGNVRRWRAGEVRKSGSVD